MRRNTRGFDMIIKTPLGLENIVASRIEELGYEAEIEPKPSGYPGLVTVKLACEADKPKLAAAIEREIPEAERVLVAEETVKASLEEIVEAAVRVSTRHLDEETRFAVRTVRRGSHPYTSIDINYKAGSAIIEATNASVNLDNPDVVVWVEVVDDVAAIGVLDGSRVWRKMTPEKRNIREYFSKASIVQMPYLGPKGAVQSMGTRIGRAVQMFEVGELVIGMVGSVDADVLNPFIRGVLEGIESRYRIQRRTYSHKPRRVKVRVQDLYQLVRDRRGEPKIVFEPEGEPFPKVSGKLAEYFISDERRVNMFFGSREGIPKGVFRFADLIIDLCPGITLSTEYAASSALIGLAFALEDRLRERNGGS